MAKYKLGEIYGEIRLKSKKWQKSLQTNKEKLKDFSLGAVRAFGIMTAAAGALVVALSKITKDTVRYGVAIDRMVKITGLAGEEVSKLQYAIEQEHGSLQALEKGLFNLTVRLGYAGDGLATYTRQFQSLGIEFQNADGTLRNTYDVFLDLVDVMSQGTISTETMAASAQLLGSRVAKELIPFMKLGREEIERLGQEAEALGLVMSTETAAGLKKVDDAITALKGSLKGFRNLIGERIAPAVEGFTTTMVNAFIEIRANIDNLLPSLADLGSDTEKMGDIGVMFAKKTITAIFTVMNAWTRLKTVYWTVRSAFNKLIQFHNLQYRILFETTVFTLKQIARVWDKVFKTDIAGTLDAVSEKFSQFNQIVGDEAVANWENAEQASADLNQSYQKQMEILSGLTSGTLHFSNSISKAGEETKKTAEEIGKAIVKEKELAKTTFEVEKNVIDLSEAGKTFGTMLGDAFKKGKITGEDLLKTLIKIGIQLALTGLTGGAGGLVSGLFGSLFGFAKGGVAIPKGARPLFAAEGMAVVNKPTVSPQGNIFGEAGSEVFMRGEQFTAALQAMQPKIVIHNANPNTYVEIIKDMSQGDMAELARVLFETAQNAHGVLGT